ncbi:MAG: chorismate synthase [Candidatus Eisenbacteria bacterium]|nr:chorismate synthase [Candidatus Latescibacterota bacterium]MBD3300869.1 chorismate synthase [Candidatus Eisenbacteria bacterium]
MGSSTGTLFRVTTWGESHGPSVGAVVDGCPPRLALTEEEIQAQLDRRRPGQSRLTTQRREKDRVRILSGLFEGRTLGTPILLLVENEDAKAGAYEPFRDLYRPSHADYTVEAKYGIRDWRGGGRASARETVGRVAAGAIAEKLLAAALGVEIVGWVARVADIEAVVDPVRVRRDVVDADPTRCPDPEAAKRIAERIDAIRREGDSLGGVVELAVRGLPPGLGQPVFEKLDAALAGAMMGLPAAKGVEIGSGFEGTTWTGSRHNDPFVPAGGRIRTASNHSGGIQGGISNGEPLRVRVGFKPTATIRKEQATVDRAGNARSLEATGRHDPCVLPRAVPIVEAMAALVLADHWLRQLALSVAADRIGGPAR